MIPNYLPGESSSSGCSKTSSLVKIPQNFSKADSWWMLRALALARRGYGHVAPNPVVGAVVVKDGKLVGHGWHKEFGREHAEIIALSEAKGQARGATLYVTLEPCNHFGNTPPCTEAVLNAGILRVVIGALDKNSSVCGGGVSRLVQSGVCVDVGILHETANALVSSWTHWINSGLPEVTLKLAVSRDGMISTGNAHSPWISSEVSRAEVQRRRSRSHAVLVGVGTVIADDPLLTNRLNRGCKPLRVVVDSTLRIPSGAHLFQNIEAAPVFIATTARASGEKKAELESKGAKVEVFREQNGRVDLKHLMEVLGSKGVQSVLCEGGGELAGALLSGGLVDEVVVYQSELVVGGRGSFVLPDFDSNRELFGLRLMSSVKIGRDTRLCYRKCI